MHLRSTLALLLCCACAPGPDRRPDRDPTHPTSTGGGSTDPHEVSVSCAPQEFNVLRWDCVATVDPPAAIAVSWGQVGSPEARERTFDTEAAEHAFTVWGLRQASSWEVRVTAGSDEASTTFDTEPLPAWFRTAGTYSGAASFDELLFLHPCNLYRTAVIVDRQGEVIWYQIVDEATAVAITPDDTVLVLNHDRLVEFGLDGRVLLDLVGDVDFPAPIHHDAFRDEEGRTWVLKAAVRQVDGVDYVVDGFHVFDRAGALIASWDLADHVTPVDTGVHGGFWSNRFPGATDFSHANSIFVDADRKAWISLRWVFAVIRVDADLASPSFGAIERTLVGSADSPLTSDYALTTAIPGTPADFIGQHDATPRAGATLTLFDNRSPQDARGLAIALDDAAGTAEITTIWDLRRPCESRGSLQLLDNGNALAVCAPDQYVAEFPPDGGTPVWSMDVSCPTDSGLLGEAIPVRL